MKDEVWQVQVGPSILGVVCLGARKRSRGPWLRGERIPGHVLRFLLARREGGRLVLGTREDWDTFERFLEVARGGGRVRVQRALRGRALTILCEVPPPPPGRRLRRPRKGDILDLAGLAEHVCANWDEELTGGALAASMEKGIAHRVYKDTSCGASFSVAEREERGGPVAAPESVLLSSIVEGTDAEVQPVELVFPFSPKEWHDAIEEVEAEAQEIWHDTHGCPACGAGCPDCHERRKLRVEEVPAEGVAGAFHERLKCEACGHVFEPNGDRRIDPECVNCKGEGVVL